VMTLTIVTLQFHYGGCFVSDPTLRYANGITSVEKINRDVDELHIMLFHKITLELGVENVETFGCRVNKKVEEQAPAPRVEEHSDSDSLYDVDENIDDLSDLDEELLQARQSNIQEQVKEKTDRVNLDEIPSGRICIDAGFEDIYKKMRGRFEGNLGSDDPYFDSSDPGSDISEDEGDPVENGELVDPTPRKESTKIYFDPTAKKTFGHNKKGCPTLKNAAAGTSAGTNATTSNVATGTSAGNAATSVFTNATIGSQTSVNAGPSAGLINATSSDVRQLSTHQSTSSAAGQKRKTSTTLRGGAILAYKKPRPKKAKTTGYGFLFGLGGSVTERSGNTDRVLHSATLSSSTPTNIDLGYKPNGLRWKGRTAITQRQLREESYRSTQGTPSTQGTH
ncbi:hypothetical protein KY290_030741, partial [Solanum tuberosum]